MKLTPYGRQFIDNKDIYYVSNALKNNLITTGPYVKKFEEKIQNILTAKYVISCNSGTAALHLALKAINLKKNDVIIMPAINFIAAYNMARLMNAKIFLADVDPFTGQMTPKTLLECVKQNKLKKIKAIVTMYLGGYPENVINFFNLKKRLKCFLIEDACHALGSKYYFNKKLISVGSCKHSDISTFSFHPVKTITSGEGGAVLTNNKFFYDRMITLRSHGIIKDSNYHWKYNLNEGGYNYRLSDINCALGYSQLKKINKYINYRKKIFNFYKLKLEKVKNLISLPFYIKKNKPSYHLFIISINFLRTKFNKDKMFKFFKKKKIIFQYHYIPIYKFKLFPNKVNLSNFRGSEYYYKNSISLPIFYNLKLNIQKKIISKIIFYLNNI